MKNYAGLYMGMQNPIIYFFQLFSERLPDSILTQMGEKSTDNDPPGLQTRFVLVLPPNWY